MSFVFFLHLVYSGLCDTEANGRRLCNFVVYVFSESAFFPEVVASDKIVIAVVGLPEDSFSHGRNFLLPFYQEYC